MVSSFKHYLFRNFFLQVFIILTYGCCTYKLYLGDTLTSLHACRKVPHSIKLLKGFDAGTLATVQKGMRARELQGEEKSQMGLMCLGDVPQQHRMEYLG